MKMRRIALALSVCALLLGGCGRKKEISEHARKEAAHLTAEADFAMNLRDWPRAESLMAKAAELCPDSGPYWVNLGGVRKRMGNRDGARSAYKKALAAYEDDAREDKANAEAWLQQVYVLALLGQTEDARKRVEKMSRQFPNSAAVRAFIDRRQLDSLLADPLFKEMAL